MAGTKRVANFPPLPLAGEGRGEGCAPRPLAAPSEQADSALTLPSPAGGRGLKEDLAEQMQAIGLAARAAARELATVSAGRKTAALHEAAGAIRAAAADILAANRRDLDAARQHDL